MEMKLLRQPKPTNTLQATVHDHVRYQSMLRPEAEALWYRGRSTSYSELQRKSDCMAQHLHQCGVRQGDIVGIALGIGEDLIVSMLAIMECGAAFLPLDAYHPMDRLQSMLADADTRLLITHDYLFARFDPLLSASGGRVLCIETALPIIAKLEGAPLRKNVTGDDLAYVMYTSGSTGQPKGVEITHRALVNKIARPGAWGAVSSEVRGALLASITFDASLAQIFIPLAHGGCVVLVDYDERLQPPNLWRLLAATQTSVIDATPSWLSAMLDIATPETHWQPQRVVLGGEPLPPRLLTRLRQLWPQATVVNAYGPTEACIDAACYEIDPNTNIAPFNLSVPIGKALPNYRIYVLDSMLQPVTPGQEGELFIAGCGLARGYRKRPQQTAECFIADPFVVGEKMYRTGDLMRMNAAGLLEFIGRCDNQIKIRGQRVELGEIESVLSQYENAYALAAVLIDDELTVCVVCDGAGAITNLREYAKNELPSAMQPQRWIAIAELPLTLTGKLDRKALHELVITERNKHSHPSPSAPAAPQNEVEEKLLTLWSEIFDLPTTAMGRDANFFELGGQSLSAAWLMARINRLFGVELGLATLFNHSTLADLAVAIQRGERGGETSGLLSLNRGNGQPLFCVPPLGGVGTIYVGLARSLAQHCPVYALQAMNLPSNHLDMDTLADHYIARMRAMQPKGPYRLIGYSAGGAVLLAMCAKLTERDESISELILIDPYHWVDTGLETTGNSNAEEMFWKVCREMLGEALDIRDAAADRVMPLVRDLWAERVRQPSNNALQFSKTLQAKAQLVLPKRYDLNVIAILIEGSHNNWNAYYEHQPVALNFSIPRLLLIQPDSDEPEYRQRRFQQWRALTGNNLKSVVVPGHHHTMLSSALTMGAIAAHINNQRIA